MSAITHIGTVLVTVADQDAALGFWHELGFDTRIDGPFGDGGRWVEMAPPGAQTLSPWSPRVEGSTAGTEVSFATSNAVAEHTALLRRGVDVDPELIRMGDYVPPMFTFRDPDGNPIPGRRASVARRTRGRRPRRPPAVGRMRPSRASPRRRLLRTSCGDGRWRAVGSRIARGKQA
jgi:Glyoxalase/Bleomycin resistance protein/Dioxygenase superfamily